MALQNRCACPSEYVVNTRHTVGARGCQFVASLVETSVENFVVVAAELLDALTGANVPKSRSPIDTSCEAVITCEVELTAGQLRCVTLKSKQTLTSADVPNLGSVIKGCCHKFVTVCVEMERNNFRMMSL